MGIGAKYMKKIVMTIVLMPLMVLAETETIDGITWTYTIVNGTAQVGTGGEFSRAISSKTTGEIKIPSMLGGRPVRSIGNWAFYDCSGLTSVTIPMGVTSIGQGAFYWSGVTAMSIPSSVTKVGSDLFNGTPFLNNHPDGLVIVDNCLVDCKGACDEILIIPNGVRLIAEYALFESKNLKSVTIPDGVTSIGDYAFGRCTKLMAARIPSSVSQIGDHAFFNCSELASVMIPACVTTLSETFPDSYAKMDEVVVADGVTQICDYEFTGCAQLRSVTLPESVMCIGDYAFLDCDKLMSLTMPTGGVEVGEGAFMGCANLSDQSGFVIAGGILHDYFGSSDCVEIPDDVWRIGSSALAGHVEMKSVTIPTSVTSIGPKAFVGCAGLTSLNIPSSVTCIDSTALLGCRGLESLTISGGVETLDSILLSECSSLQTLVLTDRVRQITAGAFKGCPKIRMVTLPPHLEDFGLDNIPEEQRKSLRLCYNDKGFMIWNDWLLDCDGIEECEFLLPESVVGIGHYALQSASLHRIALPKNLKYIGSSAFSCQGELEVVQLSDNVEKIGNEAFANDYCLDNVVIPDSVESIGDGAFSNCTEMTSIEFGEGLKSVGAFAFANCISLEAVEFKEGLETLGDGALSTELGSMRLKSVSLPVSLATIGEGVFEGCDHITGVTVPTHLNTMAQLFPNSYEKIESVVIPEGETVILDDMFKGCKALKTVVIPNSVTNIGASAFEDCEALEELGFPDSVTSLGVAAFAHCLNLKTVALPKGLTSIASRTFAECPLLDSLVVPAAVTSMGACIYSGAYVDVGYGQGGIYQKIDGRYAYWRYDAALTGIYFLGDAPEVRSDTYEGMPSEAKSYVVKGSKGWYLAGSPTLPPDGWPTCGNARAITYWTPNRFEVTFDGNGGTPETYAAEQITDTTYSLPKANPTRTGYLFDGWWTEPRAGAQIYWNTRVTATKAHTLYAHWKSLKDGITVIFNPNGGTVSPDEVEYPAGVTYGELPVPTRIGHEFLGWHTSQVGGDLVTEATEVHKENNELYAHWRPITYWVVFDANGGYGTMERQLHTYNEAKTLSANQYYLNGFKFTGWAETRGGAVKYADQKEVENLAEIQGQEVTLYAVWNGASYAVQFHGNGGYGIMENQTFVVGVSQGLAECQYSRTGYAFAGWATTPAGTVAYKDKEDVKNLTMTSGATVNLYAVWTPIQYLISYHANGGGGAMSATVAIYDEEVVLPESAFSWAGHRFVGWAMEADGEVVYEAGQRVQNLASQSGVNVILYAVWELEQVAMPTVSPADGTVFETSCQVTLACSTVGASIYYRVGAQPKATDRFKYTQPFEISETSVIYAFAKLGELQSETISVTLTKGEVLTFAKAVNAVGVDTFELGGDDVWKVIETDGAKFDAACAQSGEIGDNQTSWFKATVQGAGTIRFWWKASCEEDLLKDFDHLVFVIDGHEFGRLDGITDWIEMLIPVQTTGPHTLIWAYVKDDGLAEGDDRGWVDGISWEPLAVVDPIPEINPNADAKAVQAALEGSTDARLAENITDAATYIAYRDWALKVGAADVKASPFAWASFATDSAALLAKMPTDDDLKVEEFKPSPAVGSFDFTVSVKDVTIGDKASVDNLKKLFGLEGAESLDTAAFSSENVSLDFKEPQDGKLKFTATPAVDNAKSFFMKAMVK